MRHAVAVSGAVCFALFLLVGCGGPTTPDTEGQTLTRAARTLEDAGVPARNITVVPADGRGPARNFTDVGTSMGDPDNLVVCDHDPDGVAPTEPVNLEVATVCAEEDDSRKKKKRPKLRRRR